MKINGNESGNLLLNLKQDTIDSGNKNSGADFYTMVMEDASSPLKKDSVNRDKSGDCNSKDNNRETSSIRENNSEIKNNQHEDKSNIHPLNDRHSSENREDEKSVQKAEHAEKLNDKPKVSSSDADKNKIGSKKEQKNAELDAILSGIAGEIASKKLTSLMQSAIKGETSEFREKFRRLAADSGFMRKNSIEKAGSGILKPDEKTLTLKDTFSVLKSDFINQIGKELSKIINSRKGDDKHVLFTDKDMKEAVHGVVEEIKKSRIKEQAKTESRKNVPEEIRSDKKNDVMTETHTLKRKESGTDSGFDTGAGKDKNSSREQTNFTSGRIDSGNRPVTDKSDLSAKSPEFRQSLQEVIDKAKITVRDSNNGTFTVKLFPKELGSVNVNLLMENGVVSGKFLVDNDEAKNQLLSNLSTLKSGLAEAGIAVGEFSVNVSQDRRFTQNKDEDEDDNPGIFRAVKGESAAAVTQYDCNSASAYHDGHINMVI